MRWVHKVIDALFVLAVFAFIVIVGHLAAHEFFTRFNPPNFERFNVNGISQ